jgi:hypothetical protein
MSRVWILIPVCYVSLIVELEIVFEMTVVLLVVVGGLLFSYCLVLFSFLIVLSYSLFNDVMGFSIGMELH